MRRHAGRDARSDRRRGSRPIVFGPVATAPLDGGAATWQVAVPSSSGLALPPRVPGVPHRDVLLPARIGPASSNWVKRSCRGLAPRAAPSREQVSILLSRYVRGQLLLVVITSSATTMASPSSGPVQPAAGLGDRRPRGHPDHRSITAGAIACLVALGHPNPFGWSQLVYVGAIGGHVHGPPSRRGLLS